MCFTEAMHTLQIPVAQICHLNKPSKVLILQKSCVRRVWELMPLAMMMICRMFISQTPEIDIEVHSVLNHHRLQNLAQVVFSQNSVICVIHTQKLRLNRSLSQASLNLKEECYFGISDLDQPARVVAQDGN